ncbi:SMP-30/gluconolactonase/LRE family protein [Xanthomonas euvesicatoria pv. alangii]|nr:SMP-30/gluconolactonase/LRE family protein [Xanthomonas euvesicatoria]MBV6670038.1 SMP-30/gluconolactonase/LRE family protein [Xanthomonas euvesicatoria pv. alangii]
MSLDAHSTADRDIPQLSTSPASAGASPLPRSDIALDTVEAEHWVQTSESYAFIEGPAFDRHDNLIFSMPLDGRVMSLSPDRKLRTLVSRNDRGSAGLAIHKDGRIFIASAGDFTKGGSIMTVQADGSDLTYIVSPQKGLLPNDIVFDRHGGFYFSDFRGTSTKPAGGVYYIAPEGGEPVSILPNLAMGNGVALSPDDRQLWVTEFSRNLLHRITLTDPTTVAPFGTAIAYSFVGPAPDSIRTDSAGNVYVALFGQGRVMIFSPGGIPIGQILLPRRDEGHNLICTSLAIRPGTNEVYIVASDGDRGLAANIFRARGYAKALALYSHAS